MKTGAIAQHISDDLDYSIGVMKGLCLEYVEFCGAWEVSAGRHSAGQVDEIVEIIEAHGLPVSCVSPRSFYMLPLLSTEATDASYQADFDEFKSSVKLAKRLGCTLVRALPFQRPPVVFGANGAERALANQNRAWPHLMRLLEPIIEFAEQEDITIAIETGFETMASSCALAARMVKDAGSQNLRVMLDTGNNLYSGEVPYPEAYDAIREYLVHVQVKDARVNSKLASVEFCALGEGDMREYLAPLASALRADGYQGVVSLENVYQQPGQTKEESFRRSVGLFLEVFS